jgi:two-component system response regulator AtoC
MSRRVLRRPPGLRLRSFHGIHTVAPQMEALFARLRRIACADSTVLIDGETGTGKELVARAIHGESRRRRAPFQAVSCAAFSPALLESELFGHVRGAFTGAVRDRPGLFALADGGTLFLDEVAEIPLDLQGTLLRVLQEKTFVPVGGSRARSVDVRVLSATNRPLRREVAEGRFREDLGFRLRVVPIVLPPLRSRLGDVEALLWHFAEETRREGLRVIEGVTVEAMAVLRAYPWPGNVRELRSAVEYAAVVGEGPILDLGELPPEVRGEPPAAARTERPPALRPGESESSPKPPLPTLADLERERIVGALARHGGRKGMAATDLGMSRTTLWRKLRRHRLV